jgi:hypothetical protein
MMQIAISGALRALVWLGMIDASKAPPANPPDHSVFLPKNTCMYYSSKSFDVYRYQN